MQLLIDSSIICFFSSRESINQWFENVYELVTSCYGTLQIGFESFCACWNEYIKIGNLYNVAQQFIKFQSLAFFMADIYVYALCAQILAFYYKQTALTLEKRRFGFLNAFRKQIFHLQNITAELQNGYGCILKAKCLYILVVLIQTTYSIMLHGLRKDLLYVAWQIFVTLDMCVRFWLVCYSGDCLRNSVRTTFEVLVISKWIQVKSAIVATDWLRSTLGNGMHMGRSSLSEKLFQIYVTRTANAGKIRLCYHRLWCRFNEPDTGHGFNSMTHLNWFCSKGLDWWSLAIFPFRWVSSSSKPVKNPNKMTGFQ